MPQLKEKDKLQKHLRKTAAQTKKCDHYKVVEVAILAKLHKT